MSSFDAPEKPRTEPEFRNATREQLKNSRALPRVPFVVLSVAGRARAMQPRFSESAIEEMVKLDAAPMDQIAASIPGGRHIMIEGTGHDVHVDKPEALIAPVVEMIRGIKGKAILPRQAHGNPGYPS